MTEQKYKIGTLVQIKFDIDYLIYNHKEIVQVVGIEDYINSRTYKICESIIKETKNSLVNHKKIIVKRINDNGKIYLSKINYWGIIKPLIYDESGYIMEDEL